MSTEIIGLFVIGLVVLIGGAELLVRGAARLAVSLGVPALIIGLTVVAFGTGSPELAVAVRSSLRGQADIAFGNVVGSNIFNVLLVLGVSASVRPLVVDQQLVRLDVPIMIAVSALLYLLAADGRLGRLDGVVLVLCMIGYTAILVRLAKRQPAARSAPFAEVIGGQERDRRPRTVLMNLTWIVVGLTFLVLGSRWLVDGAVAIAENLGVSQLVIALTIVAAGTSLPEVATSVVAGLRDERDIAVGNVVGSNIFNIIAVLGIASLLAPHGITVAPAALRFDVPVMLAVAVACLPIFFNDQRITRWEGLVFVGYYVAYTAYLVLEAGHHDVLPAFSRVMSFFVIPLTLVTLTVVTARAIRRRRHSRR